MQINIKLKFDKKNKTSFWEKTSKPFFLENTQIKHKNQSPQVKDLHSFRQHNQIKSTKPSDFKLQEKEHCFTQRESRDIETINHANNAKTINSKRRSKSKNQKNSSAHSQSTKKNTSSLNVNSGPIKKNISDLIKAPKKKLNIVNNSNFGQQQAFRGSLPGLSGKKVLQRFAPLLSENQKIQLINEKTVYYIGVGAGPGQDDLQGTYLWRKHQQVGYRYELLQTLGNGAFGQVVKAFDHKNKQFVAVKIIRSKKQHMQLALNEINILMRVKEKDIENQKNIIRIKDFIVFRRHICIVAEMLSISLYELIEANNFRPIQMQYIRTFAIQILNALSFLREQNIVHSDLKPENVLLKNRSKTGIKIIDFGTSMFIHQTNYLYIQSRFYRAPEVILGASYDYAIDMWSLGCLLAELYLGSPLFAGSNEQQQMCLIAQVFGVPNKQYLKNCKKMSLFFNKDFSIKIIKGKDGKAILPESKPLALQIPEKLFLQFLQKLFLYDPAQRVTPLQALVDPWIIDGLPEDIKQQHLSYIRLKMKKEKQQKEQNNKSAHKSSAKKHTRGNSDFTAGKQKVSKHTRRRSDGLS